MLTRYLRPYRWAAVLAPLFMALEVGLELLQPRFMAVIIDQGIANGDTRLILRTCLLMLATTSLAVIGGVGCTVFSSLAGQHFGANLREALFSKVLELSFAETDKFSTASLITRLTMDVNHVQHFLVMCLRMLVRQPLTCLGGCLMAFTISPRMALFLAALIPLVILVSYLGYRFGKTTFTQIQRKMDLLNRSIQETLGGIRVIKAFSQAEAECRRFSAVNTELAEQHVKFGKCMSALFPGAMFLMNMGALLVLYKGGCYVRLGWMSVGEVLAMVNYITQVLFSFMAVTHILNDFARTKVSAQRLQEVLATTPSIQDDAHSRDTLPEQAAPPPCLEFKNVSFRYPGAVGTPVLDNLSFTIPAGGSLAILGATGAGKSTIAHLIPRFYDCDTGAILLDGQDIRKISLTQLRQRVALVPQDTTLFSGTIADNIRWGKENASEEDVLRAASIAQATEFITRFPDGQDTVVGQRGVTLSGGQKQRLSIARALVRKPTFLILDDCASALDLETERRLYHAMSQQLHGVTLLIIAQRISTARHADAILVLADGKAAAIGTHDDLMASCQIYREIVSSQTGENACEEAWQ